MAGIVDLQPVEHDPARHLAWIAEVVPVRAGAVDERPGRPAAARRERAVADDEIAPPRAAVVTAQVEEVAAVHGRVLHEKRAEAERLAAEKKAAEERAAAEAAAKRIAGAFGKGTQMGSKGTASSGQGIQGSPTGNSADGKTSGVGGYGTFDLNGRSLGPGGLPMPVYNVQEEGRVVVTITVNPAGQVIQTSINKRTNTANASLRKAAEDAARKARFNAVDGVNNQTGTITYYFKLK